eukprot:356375-Chlamydomonas_euryale.AAC.15
MCFAVQIKRHAGGVLLRVGGLHSARKAHGCAAGGQPDAGQHGPEVPERRLVQRRRGCVPQGRRHQEGHRLLCASQPMGPRRRARAAA